MSIPYIVVVGDSRKEVNLTAPAAVGHLITYNDIDMGRTYRWLVERVEHDLGKHPPYMRHPAVAVLYSRDVGRLEAASL